MCDVLILDNCVVTVVIIILLSAAVNKPTKRSIRSKKGISQSVNRQHTLLTGIYLPTYIYHAFFSFVLGYVCACLVGRIRYYYYMCLPVYIGEQNSCRC